MVNKRGFTHDGVNNKSVDWYTPSWIFDELEVHFDLDPCHPSIRIPWIPVTTTYSLPQDGLALPWEGKVWCNPPYGKHTAAWLRKMHEHRNGIALVFARTDCKWAHDYIFNADAILFLSGRVKFVDGLGATGGAGAGCGSMLAAWGYDCVAALKKLSGKGKFIGRNK